MSLTQIVNSLCVYLQKSPEWSLEDLSTFYSGFGNVVPHSSQEEKDASLSMFVKTLRRVLVEIELLDTQLLFVAGMLCECGANPEPVASEFVQLIKNLLLKMRDVIIGPGNSEEEVQHAAQALHNICPPIQAVLGRCTAGRRLIRNDAELIKLAYDLRWIGGKMLHRFLTLLDDEEILVIHVEEKKGFRVIIGGIADNDQLRGLLADRLIRKLGALQGKPPGPSVVAVLEGEGPTEIDKSVIGVWNMYNWTAFQPDGTLMQSLDSSKHWVWGEGVPEDIAPFQGTRVLLLGRPLYQRSCNACRMFPSLPARLDVLHQMPTQDVEALLDSIKNAPATLRQETEQWVKKQNSP